MAGALKVRASGAWQYIKGIKGDKGDAGPPSVGLTTLTSDYDQSIRQTGPAGGPYQLLFRRNKEAYLNDRNDIDPTGASDMGATITTYLSEYASKNIYRIYCDAGSVYKIGSTITMPRTMLLEGPGRKGQTTYPTPSGNAATFQAAGSNVTMIQMTTGTGGTNGVGLRGLRFDLRGPAGYTNVIAVTAQYGTDQFIEHCTFADGHATSTAVRLYDMLYFTFTDNGMTALGGYGLVATHGGTYYGINVGTIARNLFSGSLGAFQASGTYALRDNDFESGSGASGPAVTLGEAGMHTDALCEGNYFEAGKYHILLLTDSRATLRRNDINGAGQSNVGSYGIKWSGNCDWYEIESNYIGRVETGIILPQLNATSGGARLGPNFWGLVTTRVTGGEYGFISGVGTNIRPSLQNRGDYRHTITGALVGGEVVYSIGADTAINLAQGNCFHVQATADLRLTYTNHPDLNQQITIMNTGSGTVTLPFANWQVREGVDAVLLPGQRRMFVAIASGYGGTAKLVEIGPLPIKVPVTVTATFTADTRADVYLCDATAGAITANLPTAATWTGGPLTVKKTDASANAVTVDPFSTQTVDGATTLTLTAQWSAVTMRPSGGNWLVTGKV